MDENKISKPNLPSFLSIDVSGNIITISIPRESYILQNSDDIQELSKKYQEELFYGIWSREIFYRIGKMRAQINTACGMHGKKLIFSSSSKLDELTLYFSQIIVKDEDSLKIFIENLNKYFYEGAKYPPNFLKRKEISHVLEKISKYRNFLDHLISGGYEGKGYKKLLRTIGTINQGYLNRKTLDRSNPDHYFKMQLGFLKDIKKMLEFILNNIEQLMKD
jgi:hypothetical protein